MVGRYTLGLVVFLVWWDVMSAQARLSPTCPPELEEQRRKDDGGQAVPVSPEAGTASTKPEEGNRNLEVAEFALDSLELTLLDIEIQKAEERVSETAFWKRIIPQVHVSGSFGVRDVVFVDPTTFTPFVLPRDAYRVTVSLSLSEVLNFSKHSLAQLELEKLTTERSYRLQQKAQMRKSIEQQLTALQEQLEILKEEISIVEELLRFNQLRFEQGKIEFDALMRTKLELLSVRRAIQTIQHQKSELQLKLSQGETQ
jgi:hypothetical protein